jgi:hypothetical protein
MRTPYGSASGSRSPCREGGRENLPLFSLNTLIDPFWPAIVYGCIPNLIVIEQAAACGVNISIRDHSRVGIPVTLVPRAVPAARMEA